MHSHAIHSLPRLVTVACSRAACASAPPVAPTVAPVIAPDQKMSWILRLEDQRILRGAGAAAAVVAPPPCRRIRRKEGRRRSAAAAGRDAGSDDARRRRRGAHPPARGARDRTRRARRRAAPLLQPLLADADADVRQMAAFALGLLADKTAVPALTTALQDADPRVRGRAAEALGLIGDTGIGAPPSGRWCRALREGRRDRVDCRPTTSSGRRRRKPTRCGSDCSRSCG